MLKLFSPEEARTSLLVRQPLDEMPVPVGLSQSLEHLFGDALTPDQAVSRILSDVRKRGDPALIEWTARLDGYQPERLTISSERLQSALTNLPKDQRLALETAADRIRRFYQAQPVTSWLTQALGGTLGQLVRPIRRVGLYIPSGSAPLPSTILMAAIPAQVAGVAEIVITTPPQKGGGVAPIILAAAALLGIEEVITLGGAQAIAALAFGTQSIARVDKIFGPGNLFVTLAKRQVYGMVGIDGLAGPTETLVIADEFSQPYLGRSRPAGPG